MTNEELSQELSELIQNIARTRTEKFSEMVRIAGFSLLEDFVNVDLSGEDLSSDDLGSANFSNADLSDVNLSHTNLRNANLRNANLRNADLTGANLRNANLRNANLRNANLRATDLAGASLEGADLIGANLGFLERYEQISTIQLGRDQSQPDPYALYEQGTILERSGQYKAALFLYEKALKLQPDNYITWSQRGSVLAQLGQYNAALSSYNKALKIEANDYILWSKRGVVLEAMERNREALESYKKSSQLNPAYRAATYHRKRILAKHYTQVHTVDAESKVLRNLSKLFHAFKAGSDTETTVLRPSIG
jgi:uncharacterized protein YjbI with pentapeptide repeats